MSRYPLWDRWIFEGIKLKAEDELKFPWNKVYKERVRLGTIPLMKWLKDEGK